VPEILPQADKIAGGENSIRLLEDMALNATADRAHSGRIRVWLRRGKSHPGDFDALDVVAFRARHAEVLMWNDGRRSIVQSTLRTDSSSGLHPTVTVRDGNHRILRAPANPTRQDEGGEQSSPLKKPWLRAHQINSTRTAHFL
jgi:hypothetical protein